MLTRVEEMPTSGQFISVWKHNNTVWSLTLKYIDNKLYIYNDCTDEWLEDSFDLLSDDEIFYYSLGDNEC